MQFQPVLKAHPRRALWRYRIGEYWTTVLFFVLAVVELALGALPFAVVLFAGGFLLVTNHRRLNSAYSIGWHNGWQAAFAATKKYVRLREDEVEEFAAAAREVMEHAPSYRQWGESMAQIDRAATERKVELLLRIHDEERGE